MKNKNREKAYQKAKELVARMTLEEKAFQLTYDSPEIKRLGIKAYNWWGEALHGVARAGTATMFPQAIAMAATFSGELIYKIACAISDEGRAKYNAYQEEADYDIYKGLTFWSPNVNIFRDPRWGRGHETFGEDPYLTGTLGVAFIKGMQGDGEYMKTAACAKHFAVHSGPEEFRHSFDAVVSPKDLWETYLPAFEACVKEGDVESVMGAYNRTNGEPCCGSYFLLRDILREKWGFEGHVVSDCWGLRDFYMHHHVTSNAVESAALALSAGCDLNCGNMYLNILLAYKEGLITEEQITTSVERLYTTKYFLGIMDGDKTEYDDIPYTVVDSPEHNQLSLLAAEKSIVLLKNDGLLPIDKTKIKTVGVIGPNANSTSVLKGNYHGTASRYIPFSLGIQNEVEPDGIRVLYAAGSELNKDRSESHALRDDRMSEAVSVAKRSDVVILCLGLDATQEGEEAHFSTQYFAGDKIDIKLPRVQEELMEKVLATGKPTVLLLASGSAMDITYAERKCSAILQAWYGGPFGGTAVANVLFGKTSPSGKLPITFYRNLSDIPEFTDYRMENRTYRHFTGEVLYPFGYGLTYGSVGVEDFNILGKPSKNDDVNVEVTVKNASGIRTDEVIQIYVKDIGSKYAVKNHSLCQMKRISLQPFETQTLKLTIANKSLMAVNNEGERLIDSDKFILYAGFNQPDARSLELSGVECRSCELTF